MMQVEALDHVNLRVVDVAATLRFFSDILGMAVVPPPGLTDTKKTGWVQDSHGNPVIHVSGDEVVYPTDSERPFSAESGSGAIHHVALRCHGFDALCARLRTAGLAFTENVIRQIGLRQIFVNDANGILFELNFMGD